MEVFKGLLLCAVLAVGSATVGIDRPSEQVSAECFRMVQPLLEGMHSSLHAQRHAVHEECRRDQHELNARQEEAFRRINDSVRECLEEAHQLEADSPAAAAELVKSCRLSEHRVRDTIGNHVRESSRLHELCRHRLRSVVLVMQQQMIDLMHVLSSCAPEHACVMLSMSRAQQQRSANHIEAGNGKVEDICAMPRSRLDHNLRRACERYTESHGVLVEASNTVYGPLHATLESYCQRAPEREPEVPVFHIDEGSLPPTETSESDISHVPEQHERPVENPVFHIDEGSLPPADHDNRDVVEDTPVFQIDEGSLPPVETVHPEDEVETTHPSFIIEEEHLHTDNMDVEIHAPRLVPEMRGSDIEEDPTVMIRDEEFPTAWTHHPEDVHEGMIPYGDDTVPEDHQIVTEVMDLIPTNVPEVVETKAEQELSTLAEELPTGLFHDFFPTGFPYLGVGPVIPDKTMPIFQGSSSDDDSDSSDDGENLERQSSHSHHHKKRKVIIFSVVGVACVAICGVVAAIATALLRRRTSGSVTSQPEGKTDLVRRPLVDEEEDLTQIKQNGFENPTYSFFEGIQEEEEA